MLEKKKLRLKKFYFHPVTVFLFLIVFTIILSGILAIFQIQATYNVVNPNTLELEPTLVTVENLFSFDGIKFIISNATKNFLSFAPLGTLLISLIGLTVAEATGFFEMLTRRHISKYNKYFVTFLVLFISIISSLINEVGYAILIPLMALIYFINNRNPILGIVTAFCGVSFGFGVSIFVGSTEVALINYTKLAAQIIDENAHIALSSNLIFIIFASVILSIVGTIIIEKIIAPKIGKYKKDEEFAKTEQYNVLAADEEQQEIEKEKYEKRGLTYALIVSIVVLFIFIYSLIPNLPYSGMLLDMKERTYLNQLFGDRAYFQDGFTYIVSLFFILAGIAYGIGSKSLKNDKDLIEKSSKKLNNIGSIIILMFVVSQFIAVWRKTNIGTIIAIWLTNILEQFQLSGVPLIVITLLFIAIANIFLTSPASKWAIFSPVVVPMFMQSNISPQFAQIVMRAGDSMTKGFTPLLASYVIYIGYLNIYNLHKEKPYTIKRSLQLITPYFLFISVAWVVLVVLWYIIGLPIGPGVTPII